ncbi:MAG: hypothetical protein KDD69_09125 [Bdellovibrionales bacterium]|nr:hypothetical protein [Bdellovibrionales bacterium]
MTEQAARSFIRRIEHDGATLAIILSHRHVGEGIEFFTPPDFSQQLGYMRRPEGYEIEPHVHKLVIREIKFTQEVLVVRSGRIRVDLYTAGRAFLQSEVLEKGDVILLASGGHGFTFLEESELVEIKQGPYLSFEVDKEHFEGRPFSEDDK